MEEFDLFKVKVINQYFLISGKGSNSHQMSSIDASHDKIGPAVLAAPSSKSVKSWKKENESLHVGLFYVPHTQKFFQNQIHLAIISDVQ